MKSMTRRIIVALLLIASAGSNAQVVTYCCDATAEQQYLADMATAGLAADVTESFESATWDAVRWPLSQASITAQGITWSREGGGITTSAGDFHDGSY